jgi:cell division protein FtsB
MHDYQRWYTISVFEKIYTSDAWRRYEEPIREYILSLRDVRNIGSLAFVVLVLLISWSGIKAIQTNYTLEKQVSNLEQQNDITKLQNQNVELQNAYYKTSQYLEVSARENFGLAKPGETVLLVSKDVALRNTVDQPSAEETTISAKDLPFWQTNFRDWMNFFLHRG